VVVYTSDMPNGNHEITPAEWTKIRAFFDGISAILSKFATKHNLAVDKYYHESPTWSFRFRHPKGGGAAVHVERLNESAVRVNGSWYIDEYETFTRYFKWGRNHHLLLENADLKSELEACLRETICWEKNELTPHPDYKKAWSIYTKEEWDRMFTPERLPLLKP
jgi:hypothetical protein